MSAHPTDPRAVFVDHVLAALETPFPDGTAAVRWLIRHHGGDGTAWAAATFKAAQHERKGRLAAERLLSIAAAGSEPEEA